MLVEAELEGIIEVGWTEVSGYEGVVDIADAPG